MRTLNDWLVEYGESHQNKINQAIHKVAVPAIVFSILGILWYLLPSILFWSLLGLVLFYYFRLSVVVGLLILPYALAQVWLIYYLSSLTFMIFLFIIAWILQFIGHHIEGKRPSFMKDLQFLLIGPLWVFVKIFNYKRSNI